MKTPYCRNDIMLSDCIGLLNQYLQQIHPDDPLYAECKNTLNRAIHIRSDNNEKSNLFPVQILIAVTLIIVIAIFGLR